MVEVEGPFHHQEEEVVEGEVLLLLEVVEGEVVVVEAINLEFH